MNNTLQTSLNTDNRAVSPVIGVILMVAITVILAAVIGAFVLGTADDLGNSAPQAQLDAETNTDGTITIRHIRGDTIRTDNLNVQYTGPSHHRRRRILSRRQLHHRRSRRTQQRLPSHSPDRERRHIQ